ncbi:MAG: transposase family protein, partial [Bdellovibrionota bacterium]
MLLIPDLVPTIGRPITSTPAAGEVPSQQAFDLRGAVLRYIMSHPGCVSTGATRQSYSDGFRHKILDLREAHPEMDLAAFAEAAAVPLPTISDWTRVAKPESTPELEAIALDEPAPDTTSGRVQMILNAWKGWNGDFAPFCTHVNEHLHIDFGRTLVATILFMNGVRSPTRRGKKNSDKESTRGSFKTFFAGAEWVGDGMQVDVGINGEKFTFNLELDVDAYSGAFTGVSIRDEEDSEAVIQALKDGIAATGKPPESLLLDNRPSNHTSEVKAALGAVLNLYATLFRPENKAHVEGAFGLFSQYSPALEIDCRSPRDLAREILRLSTQIFFRATNHQPRKDRKKKSRVEIYTESMPTEEEIAAAKAALAERLRKQNLDQQTRAARLDPFTKDTLDKAFEAASADFRCAPRKSGPRPRWRA